MIPDRKLPGAGGSAGVRHAARAAVCGLVCTLLLLGPWTNEGRGQERLAEKSVQVEAPVFEDNLDDARTRAVEMGQRAALEALVGDLLAEEWVRLYDKEIRRRILRRKSRYILSFLVERENTSLDRTRFRVVLAARIDRASVVQDLEDLSLPIRGTPPVALTLFYSRADPLLRQTQLRAETLERMGARLSLLNFKLSGVVPLDKAAANLLGNPVSDLQQRMRLLSRHKSTVGMFLSFQGDGQKGQVNGAAPERRGRALFYAREDGRLLGQFEHSPSAAKRAIAARSPKQREAVLAAWIDPLVLRLQPGGIRPLRSGLEGQSPLQMRVLGFTSVEEQEAFEQAFFRQKSSFGKLRMARLSANSVTYQGPYGGNRASLVRNLEGKIIGGFKVRRVYWYNDVLEMDVKWQSTPVMREMLIFPLEKRPREVQTLVEGTLTRLGNQELGEPSYAEREDNGWHSRANPLPFEATLYGFVDTRSDRDVYVGEEVTPNERITIIWTRMGRTNLTPAIRIYDENGYLKKTFYPKSWFRYRYKVPKGQHRFFVEISDRFGQLQVDTGGYLSFHYLFQVRRQKR